MANLRRELEPGDVFRVPVEGGFRYVHYLQSFMGNETFTALGNMILVYEGLYQGGEEDLKELPASRPLYCTFTSIMPSVRRGDMIFAGSLPLPKGYDTFPLFRKSSGHDANRKVVRWYLWNGTKSWPAITPWDKAKARTVSTAGVWSYRALVQRLEAGWLPSCDISIIGEEEYIKKFGKVI